MRSSVRSRSPPPAPAASSDECAARHRKCPPLTLHSLRVNGCLLFNNTEEVKRSGSEVWNWNTGFDCIDASGAQKGRMCHKRVVMADSRGFGAIRGFKVIGSSEQVHVVDALAITGDEGRSSLRKAAGSRQTGFDPQMSEWGNPARKGHLHPNS